MTISIVKIDLFIQNLSNDFIQYINLIKKYLSPKCNASERLYLNFN